jgi:transcriptional regulator with XRE-family HTH domain
MQRRIEQILEVENLSVSQFADKIGVQRSGMSHILSGRNKPSLDFAIKVLQTFPDLSSDWLLFGKGAMYDKNADKSVSPNFGSGGDLFGNIGTVSDRNMVPDKNTVPTENTISEENIADLVPKVTEVPKMPEVVPETLQPNLQSPIIISPKTEIETDNIELKSENNKQAKPENNLRTPDTAISKIIVFFENGYYKEFN